MAVPPLYKDIGKSVKDTLEKDYEKYTPSIKLESKTENETFTFAGKRDPATNAFTVDPVSFKYDLKERGITFLGKLDSKRKICTELSLSDKLTQGLKVFVALDYTLPIKPEQSLDSGANLGVEYKRENLTATTELELVKRKANLTAVVGNKTIAGGFEVGLDLNDGVPSAYNLAAQYVNGSTTLFGAVREQFNTLRGGFHRKISDQVSVAADFDVKRLKNETNFTLGSYYSIDKESAVKAKLNTKGVVTVSYLHNFKKNIRGVFTMEADAFNLNKPDSAKIGFGLTFTDE